MRFYYGSNQDSPIDIWENFISNPPRLIAFDTETPSLTDRSVLGLGIAWTPTDSFYLTTDDSEFYRLIDVLKNPSITKVAHNAPYDLRVLRPWGIDARLEDTAIMARLYDPDVVTLEDVARLYMKREIESAKDFMKRQGITNMNKASPAAVAEKCCHDAQVTLWAYAYLKTRTNMEYYNVEKRLIPLLEQMSQYGIKLDPVRRDELDQYYEKEFSWFKSEGERLGFNPGSYAQAKMELAKRAIDYPKNFIVIRKGTVKEVLNELDDPLAQFILLYRHYQTFLTRYLRPFRGLDRAYTTFHLDAQTGRVSSTNAGKNQPDRNLSNLPSKTESGEAPTVRSMFIPDGDGFTSVDLAQIELRVLAHLSQDKVMLAVLLHGDIHAETMKATGLDRKRAKTFIFARYFGGYAQTVSINSGLRDLDLTIATIAKLDVKYPVAAAWVREQRTNVPMYCYTMYGRKMLIPYNQGEEHAMNCAVNFPIQGSAADIFKRIMLHPKVEPILYEHGRLPLHDELFIDGRHELPLEELAHIHPDIYTPMEAQYLDRWG